MKKLLTILALAALLCLVCSAALAVTDYPEGYEFANYDAVKAAVAANKTITVDGIEYRLQENGTRTKVADHGTKGQVHGVLAKKVGGDNTLYVIELTIKTTHDTVTTTTAATCGKEGKKVVTCKDCSYTATSPIAPTGEHQIYQVYQAANCQHAARNAFICNVCGAEVKTEVIPEWEPGWDPQKPHDFYGAYNDVAKYDGSINYWAIDDVKCTSGNLDGHKIPRGSATRKCLWGCGTKNPDGPDEKWAFGTLDGYWGTQADYIAWMEAHGQHRDYSYDGHDWDAGKAVDPTCSHGSGVETWCNICGEYRFRPDYKKGALGPVWVLANTAHNDATINCGIQPGDEVDVICSTCNGVVDGHKKTTAGNRAVVDEVNPMDPVKDAVNSEYTPGFKVRAMVIATVPTYLNFNVYHNYTQWNGFLNGVNMDKIEAGKVVWDAFADGNDQVCVIAQVKAYECKNQANCGCGDWMFKITQPAAGHKWSDWTLYEQGTTTNRYARTCSVCKHREIQVAKDIKDLPTAHSHKWVRDEKAVKCGETQAEPLVCTVCGEKKTGEVKMIDHDWEVTLDYPVTCIKDGLRTSKCKRCGMGLVTTTYKESAEHAWDAGKITKEATKTADGVKTFTCTLCGKTKTEPVKYVVTADPKYTLTASYNGGVVSGKLTHVEDTKEAAAKYVRVTFYIGTYYMATTAEVEADGTYAVEGVGPIDYITVVPTGNSAVNPDEVKRIGEAQEIFVK